MAYVYRHIRLDKNVPFYVGISSDSDYKRANSKTQRSDYWNRITEKTDYKVEIMLDDIDIDFAKEKEIEFISLYGRSNIKEGTLCNLTNGGEGTFGWTPTEENRKKMSESRKGRSMHSADTRAKISESTKGKKKPPRTKEHLRKLSETSKGRFFSNDARKKICEAKGKLTKKEVLLIRKLRTEGVTLKELSEKFNVSVSTVSSIYLRRTWKHI
jgi:hypothetical protein